VTNVSRSSTDRTTNLVLLSDTRLEEDLSSLLSFGEGPERLISPFLHEAIHRWCFESPVGLTLAILQLRIHRTALHALTNQASRSECIDTLARTINRYETALAFLHPLDEGMALFGEFDLKTRENSRSWSEPLDLAAQFFARPNNAQDPQIFINAWSQLVFQRMRLGQSSLDRKADVLGLPLRCEGDAYLPGYMLVRRLWFMALHRDFRLANETDLYLMYLRSFLYDDYGLVAALLDDSLDEIRGAGAVTNHIINRLDLLTRINEKDITLFDNAVAENQTPEDRTRGILPALAIDSSAAKRGESMLRNALDAYSRTENDDLDAALQFHEAQVLGRRQFQYVGSWEVDVEIRSGHCRVSKAGMLIREGQAIPDAQEGSGPGYIDVLQWIRRSQRVCAVIREGDVVACESIFVTDKQENDPELLQLLGERNETQNRLRAFDSAVEEVVNDSWAKVAVDHIRNQLPSILNQAYLPTILNDVPLEKVDSVSSMMSDDGFYSLLNYDRELIEGLAALSLCCSTLSPLENFAAAFLKGRGLSLERTLAAADDLYHRFGVARVIRAEGYLLSTI
jgi:hypothetical protein